mmetsp:Transcript_3268/g.4396  ORF Transcript_3268/g.4396 Transcript_3268/m.4396 type:complete len:105 (+) Transcript_3268:220-534(+)
MAEKMDSRSDSHSHGHGHGHGSEDERLYHTWTEFFVEPVPLTICTLSILYFLGWNDVMFICLMIGSPFILAFLHTISEKLFCGSKSVPSPNQDDASKSKFDKSH